MTSLLRLSLLVLIAALIAVPAPARAQIDSGTHTDIKAAFLLTFAKFTEWQSLAPATPLVMCVAGDQRVANALAEAVRGQRVRDRSLQVQEVGIDGFLDACNLLFISTSHIRSASPVLDSLKRLPILTVSDSQGFAQSSGIIELYVEAGRMRFAVNPGAGSRAGLGLSSRLLNLARIVGD
ncbi:hypothetical protein BH24ACI4_BH24ACI4_22650 [soil metagenome]